MIPTGTGLGQYPSHVPQTVHSSFMVEGHVSQDVEVQVLSSAFPSVTQLDVLWRPCAVR